ncbi:MAG TPA: LuxR C-terminal-related transcriptional regulator, partial [Chlamydiales bacterium]|nr:LuxR C-terminal-related transcriptional regulator [Chlamydiales bacterium]
NWKEIVQNYIIFYSDQIRKATSPLRDHFGIQYFTYHRIDREGRYTVLVDRPDWAEHYVEEQFFLNDPYLGHPDTYRQGFCLIESHGKPEHQQRILRDGKEIFNLDSSILFIQKSEAGAEFFGFAGNRKESNLEDIYLNHPEILQSFGAHFKRELSPVLTQMEREANVLSRLKGRDFDQRERVQAGLKREAHLAYLKDIGFKKEVMRATRLSKQEQRCLKLLLAGKSAKETAHILGHLSSRTVESYFENIKTKLGCWSKREAFDIAQNLENLGLLP